MADFVYNHKVYYNTIEFAMYFIGGTWNMPILWSLKDTTLRYSELKKMLPHITDKMLSSRLKELDRNGLINRKVYPQVPPKVEYSITEVGKKAIEIISMIHDFGIQMAKLTKSHSSKIL